MEILKLLWARFSIIAGVFGDMQARVIASLMYFTVLLPFGLIMQSGNHIFKQNAENAVPSWLERPPVEHDLPSAKRQG
jgi:hypothetical protein